jgi:hypothetical protein
MADHEMPPRPDVSFDFALPHGIDTEEGATNNGQDSHDFVDQDPEDYQDDQYFMEDVQHTTEPNSDFDKYNQNNDNQQMNDHNNDLDLHDQENDNRHLNYKVLPEGFSDDEDAGEAFSRSWSDHQAKKSPPKDKTSPKRSSDDGADKASPKTKKPRTSLFGGPMQDNEEEGPEERPEEYIVDRDAEPKTPGHGIGNRLSSLKLEQQEREESPSERPFDFGFGIATMGEGSDRGSMSPTPAPDADDNNFVIPPDTQVSDKLCRAYTSRTTTYIISLPTSFARILKERTLSPMSTRTRPATSIRQKRQNRKL